MRFWSYCTTLLQAKLIDWWPKLYFSPISVRAVLIFSSPLNLFKKLNKWISQHVQLSTD